jgi:hypothetical protein
MLSKQFRYSISTSTIKILLLSVGAISTVSAQGHITPPMVNIPAGNFANCAKNMSNRGLCKPFYSTLKFSF